MTISECHEVVPCLEIDSPSRGRKQLLKDSDTDDSESSLEIDSPSRGRKHEPDSLWINQLCRLEIDSPSRGRKRISLASLTLDIISFRN